MPLYSRGKMTLVKMILNTKAMPLRMSRPRKKQCIEGKDEDDN